MKYTWTFGASYVVVFILVFAWSRSRNNRAARHLREVGASDKAIKTFYREASPPRLFVRPTLFFGTVMGLATSGIWAFFT
jgi:hypothetical protein